MSGEVYLGHEERRARKAHRCELCGQVIALGCVYRRHRGIGDGRYWNALMHRACERALADLWHAYGDRHEPIPFDAATLSELIDEATVEDVARWCDGDPCGARGLAHVYQSRVDDWIRVAARIEPPGCAYACAGWASAVQARLVELGEGCANAS